MNIVLIGYRAVGKTSIGRILAQELNMSFLDTDQLLEEKIGEGIASFVKRQGWEAMRVLETDVLRSLKGIQNCVIATGGGCVESKENQILLRSLGHVVWIKAPAYKILERLSSGIRPPLTGFPPETELELVLKRRNPLYLSAADMVVDTGELGLWEATQMLRLAIHSLLKGSVDGGQ